MPCSLLVTGEGGNGNGIFQGREWNSGNKRDGVDGQDIIEGKNGNGERARASAQELVNNKTLAPPEYLTKLTAPDPTLSPGFANTCRPIHWAMVSPSGTTPPPQPPACPQTACHHQHLMGPRSASGNPGPS